MTLGPVSHRASVFRPEYSMSDKPLVDATNVVGECASDVKLTEIIDQPRLV